MHILVTGATGQLGNALKNLSEQWKSFQWTFVDRTELPIDDEQAVSRWFEENKVDVCVNAAAYTAVDKAESEPEIATLVNSEAVGFLANGCKKQHARLIHVSTDYVFDGNNANGYTPEDLTGPAGVYGSTKLLGEKKCLGIDPDNIVIRTSWVFGSHGHNFVKTMIRLMRERDEIRVVNDQIGCPTYVNDLAEAIVRTIEKGITIPGGIYHVANAGAISWFDFALAIRDAMQFTCKVHPIPSSEYPTPAKRPAFSILHTEKIEHALNWSLPTWEDGLKRCLDSLK
jgi:dTDP-4-dehydrorhamnose reductase